MVTRKDNTSVTINICPSENWSDKETVAKLWQLNHDLGPKWAHLARIGRLKTAFLMVNGRYKVVATNPAFVMEIHEIIRQSGFKPDGQISLRLAGRRSEHDTVFQLIATVGAQL